MILLVHSEEELEEMLEEQLPGTHVHRVSDGKRAEACLQEKFELVIAHADIPENRKASPEDWPKGCGLEVLKRFRSKNSDIPLVLIAPQGSKSAIAVQEIPKARFVYDGPDMVRDLVDTVKRMGERTAEQQHRVELDISLDMDKNLHTWQLSVCDGDVTRLPIDHLELTNETIKEIIAESKLLPILLKEKGETWEEQLHRLGSHLAKAIFNQNPPLANQFLLHLTPETLNSARIKFTVTKEVYPAMLEAIQVGDRDFWMLKAPVYRQLKVRQIENKPLFRISSETTNLNCLIIESHVDGYVEQLALLEERGDYPRLDHIAGEASWLEDFLKGHPSVGEVQRIDKANDGLSFMETVKKALLRERDEAWTGWHLVHYAGHSVYDEKGLYRNPQGDAGAPKTGYVVLPDHPADCLDAQTFAGWLSRGGVQFLYLSSCQSSEEDFAFELARRMVPAVVGFRWKVLDEPAREFTEKFYRKLFDKRSLEAAFYEARRDMHDSKPTDPIWAAPVLIVQVEEAEPR